MIWFGWLNAVLATITTLGIFIFWSLDGAMSGIGFLIFMIFVRIALKIVNTLFTVITGNPLFYDVKVLDNKKKEPDDE